VAACGGYGVAPGQWERSHGGDQATLTCWQAMQSLQELGGNAGNCIRKKCGMHISKLPGAGASICYGLEPSERQIGDTTIRLVRIGPSPLAPLDWSFPTIGLQSWKPPTVESTNFKSALFVPVPHPSPTQRNAIAIHEPSGSDELSTE